MYAEKIKSMTWIENNTNELSVGALTQVALQEIPVSVARNFVAARYSRYIRRLQQQNALDLPPPIHSCDFHQNDIFSYFVRAVKNRYQQQRLWRYLNDPIHHFRHELNERTEIDVRIDSHPDYGLYLAGNLELITAAQCNYLHQPYRHERENEALLFTMVMDIKSQTLPRLVLYNPQLADTIIRRHTDLIGAEVKHIDLNIGDLIVHHTSAVREVDDIATDGYVVLWTLRGTQKDNTLWLRD